MRTSVRALIRHGGDLLFIRRTRKGKEYYVLPGGAVEDIDASLSDALRRELKEEIGAEASIGAKVYEFSDEHNGQVTRHIILECSIPSRSISLGEGPEKQRQSPENKYELVWISPTDIRQIDIRPPQLGKWVKEQA